MDAFLDPTTAEGLILLQVLATIGATAVIALIVRILWWLTLPIRRWFNGRALKRILLTGRSFNFVFDPATGQSKIITFLPDGDVGEGRNSNEDTWHIRRGALEIFSRDGNLYSRFIRDKKTGLIIHTNDSETPSTHGQFMYPNFTPWPTDADTQITSADKENHGT